MARDPKSPVFLSARVPVNIRNNFKSLAARQGTNVQNLLCDLVTRYVESEMAAIPNPGQILRILKAHADDLRALGLVHLSLAGSVARGTARRNSDINLVCDFETEARGTPIHVAFVRDRIQPWLGTNRVDLAVWTGMRETVAQTLRRDEIEIF